MWGQFIASRKNEDIICKMQYMNNERDQEVPINKGDFQKVLPSIYLNDVIINFYLTYVIFKVNDYVVDSWRTSFTVLNLKGISMFSTHT